MKIRSILIAGCSLLLFNSAGITQSAKPSVGAAKANQRPVATPTPAAEGNVLPADDKSAYDGGEIIKVNTQLVSIPVRVMDKSGRFIAGLAKENFAVLEDGEPQVIDSFSNEQEPFTVALVLDMSYSATFKISDIQNAAIAFIDQLRAQDKVLVISFDAETHILCTPTEDRKEIYRAIRSTRIAAGTSVYEAMGLVMHQQLAKIKGRKAIILFSDGVDTTSRTVGPEGNIREAMELDALIYPIRYDTFADVQRMKNDTVIIKQPPIQVPPSGERSVLSTILSTAAVKPSDKGTTAEEYANAERYLQELADRTGATRYDASTLGNLTDAYAKIASQLREFYSVSYYPRTERIAGKRSSVKVRVDTPGAVVRTRDGYIAPKKTKVN